MFFYLCYRALKWNGKKKRTFAQNFIIIYGKKTQRAPGCGER